MSKRVVNKHTNPTTSRQVRIDIDELNINNQSDDENNNRAQNNYRNNQQMILESEMEDYQNRLDFSLNVVDEIKSFTEFYFLPIADKLEIDDIDYFLSVIHNV